MKQDTNYNGCRRDLRIDEPLYSANRYLNGQAKSVGRVTGHSAPVHIGAGLQGRDSALDSMANDMLGPVSREEMFSD